MSQNTFIMHDILAADYRQTFDNYSYSCKKTLTDCFCYSEHSCQTRNSIQKQTHNVSDYCNCCRSVNKTNMLIVLKCYFSTISMLALSVSTECI